MRYVCEMCHGAGKYWESPDIDAPEGTEVLVICPLCVSKGRPSQLLVPDGQIIEAEFTVIVDVPPVPEFVKLEIEVPSDEKAAPADTGETGSQGGDAQGTGSLPGDG